MSGLSNDLRLAFRVFRHGPAFATVVILTLASGIAACTIILALVNAVLYGRYQVYREPHRLVAIWEQNPRLGALGAASVRNVADWAAGARSLERIGTFEPSSFTLSGDGDAEALQGGAVSPDLLRLLDARAAVGRLFTEADTGGPPPRQVVLSHGLWQRRYGGRRDVVGRVLSVNGSPATVIGVLAEGFELAPFAGVEPVSAAAASAATSRRVAAMGIYGVVAYSVARRTREIGLRLALGAAPRRVQREVIREGLRIAVVGGLPGLALAAADGRVLAAKLHGVKAADPLVFSAAIGLIVAMVLIASLAPARRAARVQPVVALRSE